LYTIETIQLVIFRFKENVGGHIDKITQNFDILCPYWSMKFFSIKSYNNFNMSFCSAVKALSFGILH